MSTIYDWISVLVFIGLLAVFFLRDADTDVPLLRYIAAAAGCGLTNYLGNSGHHVAAVAALSATLVFAYYFILAKPKPGAGGS